MIFMILQVCSHANGTTYVWSGSRCAPCDAGQEAVLYVLFFLVLVLLGATAAYVQYKKKKMLEEASLQENWVYRRRNRLWYNFFDGAQTKVRLM
jgi:hypothetical protein